MVSIISSNKTQTNGHRLRHDIVNKLNGKIDVYGRTYNPIDYKLDGLKEYKFHIVVENTKRDYWFTEKLIDCFVTGTVPIYWGCPSIGDFFDTKGMIIFDNVEELVDIINNLSIEDYIKRLESIKNNFNKSKNICCQMILFTKNLL